MLSKHLTIINSVKIVDVEAWIGIFSFESLRKELSPSAVAHEDGGEIVQGDLINDVIFVDFRRCKIGSHVDKGRQTSGGHSF